MTTLKRTQARARAFPLPALCAAFSLLVFLHLSFTPIFEAPDEVWHYAYVRWLANGYGLPALDNDDSGANQEVAQPPLYYLIAAAISRPLDDGEVVALMWHNPGFGYQAPGTSADNKNMLIHDRATAWGWAGSVGAIRATRATSWLFGLIAVLATWALGYEATGRRRWALITASLVAFHPQFIFISGVVSNDSAAAALATGALWLAVRSTKRRPTPLSALLAGLLAGLGIITKVSLLPMVPLLGAALVWGSLQHGDDTLSPPRLPRTGQIVSIYAPTTALVGGWWYLRNALRFNDPLALLSHTDTLWGRATLATLSQLLTELPLVARSFWGAYGWGHVFWPDGIYLLLWGLSLPLLVLAVVYIARAWTAELSDPTTRRRPLRSLNAEPVALPGTLALIWLCGIVLALLRWMQQVEAPHGRLLFPALGAWALLVSLGLQRLTAIRRRIGRVITISLLGLCVILSTLAPGARIAATFAPPRPLTPSQAQARCDHPIELLYGEQIRLLCAEVNADRVTPGDRVAVRACWTGTVPIETDFTVFVQLIGPNATRVLERHTYPGLGRYPTSLWRPGEAFCDTYVGSVTEWAEAPIQYRVAIGLFNARTGERLIAHTGDGEPFDPPIIGAINVVPSDAQADNADERLDVTFDDGIRLTGLDMPRSAEPGQTITVTLTWSALAAPRHDYVAFVHLWEPEDPEPLAQHDSRPRDGWFPTSSWRAGDVIRDSHTLRIPESLPPGVYRLWAGLYRPESSERLTASDPEGRLLHDLVPLGSLQIGDR